jgi:hypothetical protein
MRKQIVIAAFATVGFVNVAAADEYYVVRDPATRHCTITTERPAEDRVVTQIGPIGFTSRVQAEDRVRTTKVCSDDVDTGTSSTTIIKRD